MTFFRMFQHLLPDATAWNIVIDKPLRRFFEGLTGLPEDQREFIDDVWLDIFPETTREIETWEDEFGVTNTNLTEQQRRDRLDALWKATGGQSPRYIQDTLQNNGFDVFVHEWWEPGTEPAPGVKACVTPRDPFLYLSPESTGTVFTTGCGEPLMECDEPLALCGEFSTLVGYPLVNKVLSTGFNFTTGCGEPLMECDEPLALCGEYDGFIDTQRVYTLPVDPDKWAYFLYIGAETFPDIAMVDVTRRDEFENLCLKICPAQAWLGILVEYS